MSSALAAEPTRLPPALPGPYADPPSADALEPHPATIALVRGIVRELLLSTPGFHALPPEDRVALAHRLVRVGSYIAECVRDDWYQSERLDQRPLIRTRTPLAEAEEKETAAKDFQPAAASRIGQVTTETLRAIAFPVFVADLIRGTFNAIQDANEKQMVAYMTLLEGASKTVDEFMDEKVSDDEARRWLAERYPRHLTIDKDGKVAPNDKRPEGEGPNFTADLDLTESIDVSDAGALEDTLVPAARRKLAQGRLKTLSTLVLMGINRIVVTGGKIRAAMGFHINTRDQAHAETMEGVDLKHTASGSFGYGWWSASASLSVAYVSSTKADSNAELNTQTDLTGEVEIHFQNDYFPIERFADAAGIEKIRANTPVPAANAPMTPTVRDTIPWGDTSGLKPMEPLGPARQPSDKPAATAEPLPKPPPIPDLVKKDEKPTADTVKKTADTPKVDTTKKQETPPPDQTKKPAEETKPKTETPPGDAKPTEAKK